MNKILRFSILNGLLSIFIGLSGSVRAAEFIKKTVSFGDNTIPYQIFLPQGYDVGDKEKKWPIILFLHGAMERGTDGDAQTKVGLGPVIKEHPEKFPALVVFPQIPTTKGWAKKNGLEEALEILNAVIRDYAVDCERIYLTGISMGGFGAWELAELYPDIFAAVVPIAASKEPGLLTKNLHDMPVFAFHGNKDGICPVESTRAMVKELKESGNQQVLYQEYDLKHKQTWEKAYQDPELFKWLFLKTRAQKK